ncbi:MAG: 50S ribosomal protein L24 [Chloroflexi bacterium]|jgi:large subunit ribosomal protein L24|nr:50S ribosomal protein L24 [Chloroflexota bacterium]MBT4073258.1 50S ribosomal protein L24 [Chloroflexota bacterium]MBT4516196.1 50S ribosomal protein L24 [Chloroflexota bacterium]MBT5318662.1 50S ribosomal protein L24 [Chloroflexota bacterium]MBT6682018.1 50S ribosomal protein L24 [Chloroflexota bacterium]
MAQRIQRGDQVKVIAGKDRGKQGEVSRVDRKKGTVVIDGVNLVTRHVKQQAGTAQAGIIQQEAPINISNVAFIDPETGASGRVGFRILEDGTKVRVVRGSSES